MSFLYLKGPALPPSFFIISLQRACIQDWDSSSRTKGLHGVGIGPGEAAWRYDDNVLLGRIGLSAVFDESLLSDSDPCALSHSGYGKMIFWPRMFFAIW